MAMKRVYYNVTVYKNTGFNGVDIPFSPSVLLEASKKEYSESYYLREDITLPSIRVNDNYHELCDVDYVCLTSLEAPYQKYYYFCTPVAETGGCCTLVLELDALTTLNISNCNFSGWQTRGHIRKEDDVLFGNTASENFIPKKPLQMSDVKTIGEDYQLDSIGLRNVVKPSKDLHLIVSSVDILEAVHIDNLKEKLDSYGCYIEGEYTDPVMYIPRIKNNDSDILKATTFNMMTPTVNGFETLNSSYLPGINVFDYDNEKVRKGVEALNSCGQLQLIASYTVPKENLVKSYDIGITHHEGIKYELDEDDNETGRLLILTGICETAHLSDLPYEYTEDGYTPKNKKCYSMFRSTTIANISTSSQITFPEYELKFGNNTEPVVAVFSDPMSNGKPYGKFMSDLSKLDFSDVCLGSVWCNNSVILDGAPNSVWSNINYSLNQQALDRQKQFTNLNQNFADQQYNINIENLERNQTAEGLGGIGTIAGGVASILGIIGGIATANPLIAGAGASGLIGSIGGGYNVATMADKQSLERQALDLQKEMTFQNSTNTLRSISQSATANRVANIRATEVVANAPQFVPSGNLALYGRNNFVVYEQRLSKEDLMDLDKYFQRYGYNGLHRELTKDCFNQREYYTFVCCEDVNIKPITGSFSMIVRNKAITQLLAGVRVWKCLPNFEKYELN